MRQSQPILDRPLGPSELVRWTFALSLLAAVGVGVGYTLLDWLDDHLAVQQALTQEAFPSIRTASAEQAR